MNTRKVITIEVETKATIKELKEFYRQEVLLTNLKIYPQQVQVNVMKKGAKLRGKAKA